MSEDYGEMQNRRDTLESSPMVSHKTKYMLYNPALVLLDIYPKNLEICIYTKMFTWF